MSVRRPLLLIWSDLVFDFSLLDSQEQQSPRQLYQQLPLVPQVIPEQGLQIW